MVAPRFLCVGMPKCGTSTLHAALAQHEQIFVPPVKELNFFAREHIQYHGSFAELLLNDNWAARQDRREIARSVRRTLRRQAPLTELSWSLRYALGRRDLAWYFSLFPEGRIGGEISPIYHSLPEPEIQHIAEVLPDLKVVILLRSPLQQIWSHCRMVVVRLRRERAVRSFNVHVKRLTEMRRTYRSLVMDWSEKFGEQVFVGYLEDMATDPWGFFANLMEFLGVEHDERALERDRAILATKQYVGLEYDVPEELRATLVEHAAIRMNGFEAIAPARTAAWRAELEVFERSGRL